jgi:hypothetical protein
MATWTVVALGLPERLRPELLLELEPGRLRELEALLVLPRSAQRLEQAGRALAS